MTHEQVAAGAAGVGQARPMLTAGARAVALSGAGLVGLGVVTYLWCGTVLS